MNAELANQIIIEALNMALLKGCYGLQEATNIVKAIDYLSPKETQLPPNFNEPSK